MPIRNKGKRNSCAAERYLYGNRLDFSQHLLKHTTRDRPKFDFLSDVLSLVLEYSGCDAVELWLKNSEKVLRYEASGQKSSGCEFRTISKPGPGEGVDSDIERLCISILHSRVRPILPLLTKYGSFWTGDTHKSLLWDQGSSSDTPPEEILIGGAYRSLAVSPLHFGEDKIGLLLFKNKRKNHYTAERMEYIESIAAKFELALLHHHSQARLHERVKELTCLYGIAQIASQPDITLEKKLANIVTVLPPAWQYPEHACARIVVEGKTFQTPDFLESSHKQMARIRFRGKERGMVEVHYPNKRPFLQENPFLDEEQSLIDNIAGQIALMIEHRETETVRFELQNQLIRADRLAAIGQLAAGVAHELNEPLNTILGFSQLVLKTPEMPQPALEDVKKITDASLHARTIIRELLIFARQTSPSRTPVNLNRIIEEELSLFESLCSKSGVVLQRFLDPDLPEIVADKSQLLQILSNLMVNALQAMPDEGVLTIRTTADDHSRVSLVVQDTGTGMSDEVKENIFLPFFTTKDVDQGTGLGLAVVHGIVTAHRGEIQVESTVGQGTRFLITLPCKQNTIPEEN
ncbi:MAG TPA: hypothetical protein ENN05_03190 [Deltaproteobacteria bacterium]|nr:hypothetical protein [Deltaproteobacteria bacterium]